MFKTYLLAAAVALLAGCANTGTPRLDDHFGYAVNMAKAQQTINPDASLNTDPVAGLDGRAANEAIERYIDSFEAPPPSNVNVINIGGGITGQ
jgi:hypothetical protein